MLTLYVVVKPVANGALYDVYDSLDLAEYKAKQWPATYGQPRVVKMVEAKE